MPIDITNTAQQVRDTGPDIKPATVTREPLSKPLSFEMLQTPAKSIVSAREIPPSVLNPLTTNQPVSKKNTAIAPSRSTQLAADPVLNPALQQKQKTATGLTVEEERSLVAEFIDLVKRNQCSSAAMATATPFIGMLLNHGASERALLLALVVAFGMWMTSDADSKWWGNERKEA